VAKFAKKGDGLAAGFAVMRADIAQLPCHANAVDNCEPQF
jgi:hypothetical protein